MLKSNGIVFFLAKLHLIFVSFILNIRYKWIKKNTKIKTTKFKLTENTDNFSITLWYNLEYSKSNDSFVKNAKLKRHIEYNNTSNFFKTYSRILQE